MTLRHAAALALVGWYLMTPPGPDTVTAPGSKGGEQSVSTAAPLSKWIIGHVYDKAEDCDREKIQARQEGYDLMAKDTEHSESILRDRAQGLIHAECIATDDPRLKEK